MIYRFMSTQFTPRSFAYFVPVTSSPQVLRLKAPKTSPSDVPPWIELRGFGERHSVIQPAHIDPGKMAEVVTEIQKNIHFLRSSSPCTCSTYSRFAQYGCGSKAGETLVDLPARSTYQAARSSRCHDPSQYRKKGAGARLRNHCKAI